VVKRTGVERVRNINRGRKRDREIWKDSNRGEKRKIAHGGDRQKEKGCSWWWRGWVGRGGGWGSGDQGCGKINTARGVGWRVGGD
jgi:hypothetical protein